MTSLQSSPKSLKDPPILVDEEDYLKWKEDLNVWEHLTDLEVNKRGQVVYMSLGGQACDYIEDLSLAEISANNGVKKILDRLDKVFLKDKDTQTFIAFETFYNYRRTSSENIADFLVHFEYLCDKFKKQEIILPQGVLAFLLLKASNISTEKERLARANCPSMTYENIKACIMKVFGDSSLGNGERSAPIVKYNPMIKSEPEDALQSNISFQDLSEFETEIDYNSDHSDEEYRPDLKFDHPNSKLKSRKPNQFVIKNESESETEIDFNSDKSDDEYRPGLKFRTNSKLKIKKTNQFVSKNKKLKDNSVHCNDCGKMCKDMEQYDIHFQYFHSEILCESCPRLFKGSMALKTHINSVHKPNLTCRLCGKHFESSIDMTSHIKLFHKDYKADKTTIICDICGKLLLSRSLTYHMKTHLTSEVYNCDQCDFYSHTKLNVKNHWRKKHSNLAPVKCKVCEKDFANMDSCRKHMREYHSSTSADKPFICAVCDKAFKKEQHLKRHQMLHSGEKPFGCTLCDYRTNQRSNVNVHMKSHRNQLSEENIHL